MSEMRRAAASLLERRTERYPSTHGLEESRLRLEQALARSQHHDLAAFTPRWSEEAGNVILEVTYEPEPRVALFLKLTSLVFALLLGASAWVLLSDADDGALTFLLPLATFLGVLGSPFVTLAFASARAAREAQARRAIRRALEDDTQGN